MPIRVANTRINLGRGDTVTKIKAGQSFDFTPAEIEELSKSNALRRPRNESLNMAGDISHTGAVPATTPNPATGEDGGTEGEDGGKTDDTKPAKARRAPVKAATKDEDL